MRRRARGCRRVLVVWNRREDDQRCTFTGEPDAFPVDLIVRDTRRHAWAAFGEDPQTWARYLWTKLRTGYLTAVTITDTDPDLDPDPAELAAAMAGEGTYRRLTAAGTEDGTRPDAGHSSV